MVRKTQLPLVLASCLLFSSSFTRTDGFAQTGKVCATAGAALLGIGGLMGLCSWLSNESDEQLLRNVHDEYKQLYDTYTGMVNRIDQVYHVYNILTDRHRIVTDINETLLYEFATQARQNNTSMTWVRNQLNSRVSSLRSRNNKLARRLHDLRAKVYNDYEAQRMLREMDELVQTVDQGLPHFELLRDYLTQHKSYFALYEAEDQLRTRYERELQALTDYPNDSVYIRREIKRAVIHASGRYPYVSYVERLDNDIQDIEHHIGRSAYNYADRLRWARWVSESLTYVKGVVVVEPAYTDEIRMRERERVEQEQGVI